jgi:hypothetical protein
MVAVGCKDRGLERILHTILRALYLATTNRQKNKGRGSCYVRGSTPATAGKIKVNFLIMRCIV